MSKLTRKDLIPYDQYKNLYEKFLKEVIDEKKIRRVQISDKMTGLFESKLTVFYQIQEMIRAEHITNIEYIEEMLVVYNELLPDQNELAMTLFIEIPNQNELRKFNKTIIGIEDTVEIIFEDYIIKSYEPDSDDEKDEKYTQSVHYLHFLFNEKEKDAFLRTEKNVFLMVNHPNYNAKIKLSDELVKQLQAQISKN